MDRCRLKVRVVATRKMFVAVVDFTANLPVVELLIT